MVKGKQIWDFDKPMLKIADTGSPLNTVLLDTGFDCYKDTIYDINTWVSQLFKSTNKTKG